MSERIKLRSRRGGRDPYRFPVHDDALGNALFGELLAALARGPTPPSMLTLLEHEVLLFELPSVLALRPPLRERVVAGLAGQPGAVAASLVGRFNLRVGPDPQPVPHALVYLEWPDNRWWTAWQPIDTGSQPLGDGPKIRRAVDGWPRPGGVGGWFAACRRMGIQLKLTPLGQDPDWVH